MSKGLKILIWVVSIILVLALLLVAAIKIFFPAEKVQALIVENLQKSLNRPVTVKQASVSIWGGIGLELDSLVVQNLSGFSSDEFFVLDKLDVKLKLWPLISGNFEFTKIILDGLMINLERAQDGKLNFEDLGQAEEEQVEPAKGATSIPFLFHKLSVENSRLNFYDDSSGYTFSLDGMSLNTELKKNGFEDAYYAQGQFGIDNIIVSNPEKEIEFPHLTLDADMQMKLYARADILEIEKIDIRLAELQGQITGKFTSLMSEPTCNLDFRTKRFSVEQLLSLVPPDLSPAINDLEGSGDMFATASVQGPLSKSDELDVSGRISFDKVVFSSRRVDGDFRVESGEINLKQKAANILFENCTFAGEPFSLKVFVMNIVEPVINADISMSINLRTFKDYTEDINELSGRLYGQLNITSDLKNPVSTVVDGGIVLEDLILLHADLEQKVEEVDMELGFRQRDINLEHMEAEIGNSRFALDGTMKNMIPFLADPESNKYEPTINFELNAEYLNLDELQEMMPWDTARVVPGTEATAEVEGLPDFTALGSLRIDRGTYSNVEFENFTGSLDYRDNILHLANLRASLYDGTAEGEAIMDYEDFYNPEFQVDFKADNIQINSFLSRMTPLDNVLFGEARMNSSFSGIVGEPSEVLDSLTANGTVNMSEGRIENLPVLEKLANQLGFKAFEEKQIRNLNNTFGVEDGRIRFDNFNMSIGNTSWNIDGSAGFDGSLDYSIGIETDRANLGTDVLGGLQSILGGGSGRITIPVRLTGSYTEPKFSIDRSKLQESADKKLKEEGKKLFDNLFKDD
ncbi:MAG: AsmA family protein [candidate division Zixibacteria bacterium]|nr:AsmA family protein [candidate division Zixibacteria bacterium]NIR62531.1 AsmA family protein [candidate division Zixibacteria bacterium]NIS14774.1 AsmA family protein [candidate division Zixibacteria bacterium]NIS46924.1 AsmA family protein [candidate division Zixibacteria bacterium]NIT51313.1 AsmA family protein [candidate division Zixibacteria bacterium]